MKREVYWKDLFASLHSKDVSLHLNLDVVGKRSLGRPKGDHSSTERLT